MLSDKVSNQAPCLFFYYLFLQIHVISLFSCFFFQEFAVVAKVTEREPKPPKEGEVPKQKKTVTKGDVMQALRQKCNQLIFQTNRPSYNKGN